MPPQNERRLLPSFFSGFSKLNFLLGFSSSKASQRDSSLAVFVTVHAGRYGELQEKPFDNVCEMNLFSWCLYDLSEQYFVLFCLWGSPAYWLCTVGACVARWCFRLFIRLIIVYNYWLAGLAGLVKAKRKHLESFHAWENCFDVSACEAFSGLYFGYNFLPVKSCLLIIPANAWYLFGCHDF